jgi:hypothetical protein
MSYLNWFNTHASKHKKIVDRLLDNGYTKEMIVDYFDFDNMVVKEVDFCPLYKKNKKCHEMDKLNCYLCACPNFVFDDEGLEIRDDFKILSRCRVGNGDDFIGKGVIHHDCSKCEVPHHKTFIMENFSTNWGTIMARCTNGKIKDDSKD